MALDPRTPVLVGAGQVTSRPDRSLDLDERPEPVDLMVQALRAAAEDCSGAREGAGSTPGDWLLAHADSLRIVGTIGWRLPNPGLLVADRAGIEPRQHLLSTIGGNQPQSFLHQSARAIADGDLDVVLVAGAECVYTLTAAARTGTTPRWSTQPADTPPAERFGTTEAPATDDEVAHGITLPIHAYPLFENAIRARSQMTIEEHRTRIGKLWAGFSQVAAANPYAWLREARSAEEIMTVSASNRMVAFPYPKLCTANLQVDQGAAFICCSVEAARRAGVPPERWVFPLSGADAHDHWYISDRPDLDRSPAIRLAGERALFLAGVGVDDIEAVDLYSCFPAVVQIAAAELGLPLGEVDRPLTLTGGLTFAGGPGNNYASHGIAALVDRLRHSPGSIGLSTGLGWYATKHAVGICASRPPTGPFKWEDMQPEVDLLPRCPVDTTATGPVTVETFTVLYDHDGRPEKAIVACRTRSGARSWATTDDPSDLAGLVEEDGIRRTGHLHAAGATGSTRRLSLAGS